jgi:DNA-binding response OmpR family regulator
MDNKKILLVDDEEMIRLTVAEYLRDSEFDVTEATNGAEAISIAKKNNFDAVITDLAMPGMDGPDVALFFERNHPSTPIFVITGSGNWKDCKSKLNVHKIAAMFGKPIDLVELESAIKTSLDLNTKPNS